MRPGFTRVTRVCAFTELSTYGSIVQRTISTYRRVRGPQSSDAKLVVLRNSRHVTQARFTHHGGGFLYSHYRAARRHSRFRR